MTPALVLFALEREAAPFRRRTAGDPSIQIRVSGVGRSRARARLEEALKTVADASGSLPRVVIAAGYCGALVPELRVGDIVTDPHIVTVDHLVADPEEKRRLAVSGARGVEMESAAIAQVCAERGIPFTAIRAVSDTSDTALSPELSRLLAGGHVSVGRAIAALIRKPRLLGEFLRLGRDTKRASHALADALIAFLTKA